LRDEHYTTVKTIIHSYHGKLIVFSVCRHSFMWTQPRYSGCVRVPV